MKEDQFISLIKNLLPASASYIGDDTAYIPEKDLILSQDTLIEDVHFRQSTISPYNLGIKSIVVNLSDIAASGGVPVYVLISLSMPENIDEFFIKEFYKGIKDITEKYNVIVVGGDLTKASKVTISITVIGYGNGIIPAKRSNAKAGDLIVATGEFGSSGAGLWLLENKFNKNEVLKNIPQTITEKFIKAHINPEPKLEEGRIIAKTCKNPPAIMDASDGLADALYKISLQSNVSMEINYADIPIDKDLYLLADIAQIDPFKWVFYGGEDYQLIATLTEECYKELLSLQTPVKLIGKVIESMNNPTVYVKLDDKTVEITSKSLDKEVFSHFKGNLNQH